MPTDPTNDLVERLRDDVARTAEEEIAMMDEAADIIVRQRAALTLIHDLPSQHDVMHNPIAAAVRKIARVVLDAPTP